MGDAGDAPDRIRDERALAGTVGIAIAVLLAVVLSVHPPGSTELYADPLRFVAHVDTFWVVTHLLAGLLLLALPLVLGTWAQLPRTAAGGLWARLVARLSVAGAVAAIVHLVGTDTMTFLVFQPTVAAHGDDAVIGAAALLSLHAATLVVYTLTVLFALPLLASVAAWADRDWGWRLWLPLAGALVAGAAVVVTVIERQWTTVSEMVLFRSSAVVFLVWVLLISLELRRAARSPAPTTDRHH